MSRVYTKFLAGTVSIADGTYEIPTLIDTWQTQEDLRVIGWRIGTGVQYAAAGAPTADGSFSGTGVLTFAGAIDTDSMFGKVVNHIQRHLFGSPASGVGWPQVAKEDIRMLSDGNYIDAKEGEEINLFGDGANDSGLDPIVLVFEAVIYYTKKS